MCGRYHIDDGRDSIELHDIIEAVNRRSTEPVKTSGEIFPSDLVPVIANSKSLAPTAFAMRWGYTLEGGRRLINARSETAATRPMFRDGMRQRRCAVPATNYYEWRRMGGVRKEKYAIQPIDSELFYMAGIYRIESGRPVFTILTREPAERIAFIHDRMPVILPTDLVADWLDPGSAPGEILEHAVLSVIPQREQGDEQLSMTFDKE